MVRHLLVRVRFVRNREKAPAKLHVKAICRERQA
jgi:hypothetical protein